MRQHFDDAKDTELVILIRTDDFVQRLEPFEETCAFKRRAFTLGTVLAKKVDDVWLKYRAAEHTTGPFSFYALEYLPENDGRSPWCVLASTSRDAVNWLYMMRGKSPLSKTWDVRVRHIPACWKIKLEFEVKELEGMRIDQLLSWKDGVATVGFTMDEVHPDPATPPTDDQIEEIKEQLRLKNRVRNSRLIGAPWFQRESTLQIYFSWNWQMLRDPPPTVRTVEGDIPPRSFTSSIATRTKSLSTGAGAGAGAGLPPPPSTSAPGSSTSNPSDSYPSTKFNERVRQRSGESVNSLERPAKLRVLPLLKAGDGVGEVEGKGEGEDKGEPNVSLEPLAKMHANEGAGACEDGGKDVIARVAEKKLRLAKRTQKAEEKLADAEKEVEKAKAALEERKKDLEEAKAEEAVFHSAIFDVI